MIHNEYSDPRALIDDAIATGQFSGLFDAMRERRDEKADWDYYLAKVKGNMTFRAFREACRPQSSDAPVGIEMTQEEIIAQTLAIAGVSYSEEVSED